MYEYEEALKAKQSAALNQCAQSSDRPSNAGLGALVRQQGIRQRIARTIEQGEGQIRRIQAAHRAQQIVEQHPEFAELLDLLNEI